MKKQPIISVIVPVYNGEKYMEKCLTSLLKQSIKKEDYEIIIIDNNSTDNTVSIVKKYSGVVLAYENKKGSYAARNRGIDLAKGKYIAFTDVDCIVDQYWLQNSLTKMNKTEHSQVIAGKVEYLINDYSVWGAFDTITFLNQEHNTNNNIAVTANLIVDKDIFKSIGKFDSDLQSAGDVEWTKRLRKANIKLVYDAEIKVYHPVRDKLIQNVNKCYRVGFGNGQLLRKQKRIYAFIKPSVTIPLIKNFKRISEISPYTIKLNFFNKSSLICSTLFLQIINYSGKVMGMLKYNQ